MERTFGHRAGKSSFNPCRFISGVSRIKAKGIWGKHHQAILTGEAFPVEKKAETSPEDATLAERRNCVFMGTSVRSGTAVMLVVQTGASTEFGQIAKNLTLRPPETEFERGVRRFGYLLTQIMLVLTLAVFAINVIFQKPAIDSLLFSVALAVGITPQLLPAIISITLAKEGVIVRRLTAIENFGSMDVLCTDKTGTLTEGVVRLDGAVDVEGQASDAVFHLAYLNSSLQMGMVNSLDAAIVGARSLGISAVKKRGEIPYDFNRKRLSVIVQEGGQCTLIVKGALNNIMDICNQAQIGTEIKTMDAGILAGIQKRFAAWSDQGIRVLGIAQKAVAEKAQYAIDDEKAVIFTGFLLFFDPPKADVKQTIADLAGYGVGLRIITGDNKLVAMSNEGNAAYTATAVLYSNSQAYDSYTLMMVDN